MAGYVFAIGGDEDPVSMIRECAEKGIYSTYLKGIAPLSFEGTLPCRIYGHSFSDRYYPESYIS